MPVFVKASAPTHTVYTTTTVKAGASGSVWFSNNGTTSATNQLAMNQYATQQMQNATYAQQAMLSSQPSALGGMMSPPMLQDHPDGRRLGYLNARLELPDGAFLVFEDGKYRIEDKDAKITYRANRVRAFNRYLNASDLLRDFIADLGTAGARQSDVLAVPIELFINWLILKSAEQDDDKPGALIAPRCRWCARFVSRARATAGILFCGEQHMANFMRREALA